MLLLLLPTLLNATTNTKLIWSDEFNYIGLPDSKKWTFVSGDLKWCNDKQFYLKNRNAWVENGTLKLTAKKENYHTNKYTSAMIRSRDKGDWTYCRVEVRAKLPKGRGTHAAIWMKPTIEKYGPGFKSGEIDIMEAVGFDPDLIYATVHTEYYNLFLKNQETKNIVVDGASDDFHIYAVDWDKNRINFYVDGTLFNTYTNDKKKITETWPFNIDFFLYLNLAVGSDWASMKGIDDSIFPQNLEIDYVRVYKDYNYATESNSLESNEKEILQNPEFTKGTRDWEIYTLNGAAAEISSEGESDISVTIEKQGDNTWDIGFYQRDFALSANKRYTLTFKASSDRNQEINFGLQSDLDYEYFFNKSINISNNITTYSFIIETDLDRMDSRLIFNLGRIKSDIRFHEIHLYEK